MSNGCSVRRAAASAPFIVTEIDPETGAMFARNPWSTAFGSRVAFADLAGRQKSWTGDRREFLGRNGIARQSGRARSGRTAALRTRRCRPRSLRRSADRALTLAPGAERRDRLLPGRGRQRGRRAVPDRAIPRRPISTRSFARSCEHWDDVLGAVQVKTPDRSMDIMLNRWLLYQTLACRVWARSAFYQASGAYGFRDQLQDGMALALSRPAMTREHLLRAAARQFVEGDVQHWWLPPFGPGRAHAHFRRPRLAGLCRRALCRGHGRSRGARRAGSVSSKASALRPDEDDAYFQPTVSDETRLAVRALRARRSIRVFRSARTDCR